MVFIVIVLCLLSERFLLHRGAVNRFDWFLSYAHTIITNTKIPTTGVRLAVIVLPFLLICWFLLLIFNYFLFGLVAFILNIAILIYCIGPENPFYTAEKPIILLNEDPNIDSNDQGLGQYLTQVNEQLFAVLFWYIAFGPVGALAYRLMSLARHLEIVNPIASRLFNCMDWLPVRITALLYLFVGNFQMGFRYFSTQVYSTPAHNQTLLSHCALQALGTTKARKQMTILDAERMVEHATIVLLVFMAMSTLLAWY